MEKLNYSDSEEPAQKLGGLLSEAEDEEESQQE